MVYSELKFKSKQNYLSSMRFCCNCDSFFGQREYEVVFTVFKRPHFKFGSVVWSACFLYIRFQKLDSWFKAIYIRQSQLGDRSEWNCSKNKQSFGPQIHAAPKRCEKGWNGPPCSSESIASFNTLQSYQLGGWGVTLVRCKLKISEYLQKWAQNSHLSVLLQDGLVEKDTALHYFSPEQ